MVGVAQLVRAPGCGPGGRGFKSHHSPKYISGYSVVRLTRLLWEQEIGSSNLSTPTHLLLMKSPCLATGAQLFLDIPHIFILYQTLSFITTFGTRLFGTHFITLMDCMDLYILCMYRVHGL